MLSTLEKGSPCIPNIAVKSLKCVQIIEKKKSRWDVPYDHAVQLLYCLSYFNTRLMQVFWDKAKTVSTCSKSTESMFIPPKCQDLEILEEMLKSQNFHTTNNCEIFSSEAIEMFHMAVCQYLLDNKIL